jgi:hypothetical protein
VQRQQLPTERQVLEDEVLPGTENADQPTEEMSERHDHSRNHIGKVRIEFCAKSFILRAYDVLARHNELEEPVALVVEKYATFIDSTPDHVVNSALKIVLWRDRHFIN